jgi:hypothetical protein
VTRREEEEDDEKNEREDMLDQPVLIRFFITKRRMQTKTYKKHH